MTLLPDIERLFTGILKAIHLGETNEYTISIHESQVMDVLNAIEKAKTLDEIKRILEDNAQ